MGQHIEQETEACSPFGGWRQRYGDPYLAVSDIRREPNGAISFEIAVRAERFHVLQNGDTLFNPHPAADDAQIERGQPIYDRGFNVAAKKNHPGAACDDVRPRNLR